MTSDWQYFAEFTNWTDRPRQLRAVYRSRPVESLPRVGEDYLFRGKGWRPTTALRVLRMGHGDHDTVEITEAEAQRLTEDVTREWRDALRGAATDVAGVLRSYGKRAEADEIESLSRAAETDAAAEARLHDLVTGLASPVPDEHLDPRMTFNRSASMIMQLTEPQKPM